MQKYFKRAIENIGFILYASVPGVITFYIYKQIPTNPSLYFFGIITIVILFGYIISILIDNTDRSDMHEAWYEKEKTLRKEKNRIYSKYKKDLDKISKETILIDKVKVSQTSHLDIEFLNKSKYGGLPALEKLGDWPRNTKGEFMSFLGQINFEEIYKEVSNFKQNIPDKGILLLFGDNSERDYISIFTMPINNTTISHLPDQKTNISFCLHKFTTFWTLPELSNYTVSPRKIIKSKQIFTMDDYSESDYTKMSINIDRLFGYQTTIQGHDLREKVLSKKDDAKNWILLWEITDDYRKDFYMDIDGNIYVFIEKPKLSKGDFTDLRIIYDQN